MLLNTLGTVFGYVLYVKLHAILPGISRIAKEKNVFCLEAAGTILLAYISYLLLGVYYYRTLFLA
ncbi:MAG: hypothetical protein E7256_16460 [Lachnospiraceae bacterium]|nr:hypothetical protein [Lachnospiraceae bacterium]